MKLVGTYEGSLSQTCVAAASITSDMVTQTRKMNVKF